MRRLVAAALIVLPAACAGPRTEAPLAPPAAAAASGTAVATPVLNFPDDPFRAKQPQAGEPHEMQAPRLERFELPDGISVFLVERHNLPIVSLFLDFEGGSAVDPRGKEGMASVCAGLMSDGTAKLDKIAFEEALADMASDVNSDTTVDQHRVSMSTLRKNLDATLDLWADTLLRPALRQDELDRDIKRRIAGLAQLESRPAAVAGRLAGSIVYGPQHLHGRFPTESAYRAVRLADCKRFVAEHVKPQGAQLFAVGDITRDELAGKLTPRLAGWSGRPRKTAHATRPQPRKGKIFFVDMPRAAQSVVHLLALGPPRKAPDFQPTNVMSGILGGGFTSRINMNIREQHGYAYGASGGFQYTREGSTFRATASVRTNVTKESIQEMLKEIRGLAGGEPEDDEVAREKDGRILALPARFATGVQTLAAFHELVYFGLPLDYWSSYVAQVRAVDRAAVKKAAATHLRPADLRILVVGDRATVLPKLEELVASKEITGDIVMLDAEGKPVARGTSPTVKQSETVSRTRAGRGSRRAPAAAR
jgi:zinc protease